VLTRWRVVVAVAAVMVGSFLSGMSISPEGTGGSVATAAGDPFIVAAGDIACSPQSPDFHSGNGTATKCRQSDTASLAAAQSAAAALELGDEQYYCGLLADFKASYDHSWGALSAISFPVPGNHEYAIGVLKQNCAHSHAEGYFAYFGAKAGDSDKGYYAYDVGSWHMIALNSECTVVSCATGSAQETWLKRDLSAHSNTCTLAYFHRPLFSSATGTQAPSVTPLWRDLYEARAEVVLNGHAHNYERFAPQDPTGHATATGLREFIVGTGGVEHGGFRTVHSNSQIRNASTFGVLKLTLHPTSYDWAFLPIPGQSFHDSGTSKCN